MDTIAHPIDDERRFARVAALLRSETGRVRIGLGLVGLHVADDNFLQPAPGTSAGDHLASGLVPLAVLAAVAWLYPLPRAGVRALLALTFGALGLVVGGPTVYALSQGSASGDAVTGVVALAGGATLLLAGPSTLWQARRRGGSRGRRLLLRALTAVGGAILGLVLAWVVVFPIGVAYVYTHTGRSPSEPDLGLPAERVTVTTGDGLDLVAWYAPSRNGAAVVVYPGATRAAEARMLARNGYGALLLEPRGQGGSEGDVVRWAGERDLLAGAAFLQRRPDVDPGRIGGIGFSIGGENLLEAAARSTAFAAVVSEGAGSRVGDADVSGLARAQAAATLAVMTAATAVFSNERPPPPIVERIGRIAPRAVLLIYAEPGAGDEDTRQPVYHAAAGEPKAIWRVPGAKHTGGIDARPAEYERRVVGFLDRALLGKP